VADIRVLLTDKAIGQLPVPDDGWYLARDSELKGFFVVVGKRKRTFTVQGDLRKGGKRLSSVRVSIGDTREISTRTARAIAKEYLARISQGQHPKASQDELRSSRENAEIAASSAEVTLRQAWQRYLDAHLVRKNRSEKTIAGYRDHVERILAEWFDTPLRELGADPARVARRHDDISNENGSYIANGTMRTLRCHLQSCTQNEQKAAT
jgi:hypothetical protein